jgi:hypothetical protein
VSTISASKRANLSIIGHWDNPEEAHGDKRNPEDLERWRGLAKIGTQMERHIIPEQATLNKIYGMQICLY